MKARGLVLALLLVTCSGLRAERGPWRLTGAKPDANSYSCMASASETRIPDPDSSITDNVCSVWTLGSGTTPNIEILWNGSPIIVGGVSVKGAQILWLDDVLYLQQSNLYWYAWSGSQFLYSSAEDPETGDGDPPVGFFVSTGGSDSNNCTAAQSALTPKLTIGSARSCLGPGDTLWVRGAPSVAGVYDEGFSTFPSGTSWAASVRVAAYPGETVWITPSVHGSGNPGSILRLNAGGEHYIDFDGINMDGSAMGYGTVSIIADDVGEPHHIRIQNAEVIGMSADNSAVSMLAASAIEVHNAILAPVGGFEFVNLTIHGGGKPGGTDYTYNGYGIYLATGNSLIEGCTIYDNKGAAIHAFNDDCEPAGMCTPTKPTNNVIRNNIIRDQTRATVGGQSWGILVYGVNNQVYNNIVYNVQASSGGGGGHGIVVGAGSGVKVWNNTLYDNDGWGIEISAFYNPTGTVVQNNISYANGGTYTDGGTSTTHTFNLEGTNPLFVNAGAFNFSLQTGSPAENTGTDLSSGFNSGPFPLVVPIDIVGTTRFGTWDRGAVNK